MSTHNIPLSIIRRKSPLIIPNIIMSAAMGFFFQGTPERVRNSRGKHVISARATGGLLYFLSKTLIKMKPNCTRSRHGLGEGKFIEKVIFT